MAALDQGLDERADIVHGLGDLGLAIGLQQTQCTGVRVKGIDVARREGDRILSEVVGAVDDLVVDIGEVADEGDLPVAVAEVANKGVEHDHRPGVAHVAVIVDRHAADIEADVSWLDGLEVLDLAGSGVVQAKGLGHDA